MVVAMLKLSNAPKEVAICSGEPGIVKEGGQMSNILRARGGVACPVPYLDLPLVIGPSLYSNNHKLSILLKSVSILVFIQIRLITL